jgi:hypothetical protein
LKSFVRLLQTLGFLVWVALGALLFSWILHLCHIETGFYTTSIHYLKRLNKPPQDDLESDSTGGTWNRTSYSFSEHPIQEKTDPYGSFIPAHFTRKGHFVKAHFRKRYSTSPHAIRNRMRSRYYYHTHKYRYKKHH